MEDGVVGEAQHAISCRTQPAVTFRIVVPLCLVDAAIEFKGQAAFQAAKIENERADRMLAAKFDTVELAPSNGSPQQLLCRCRASA